MNTQLKEKLKKIGIAVPKILLPKNGINMTKWATIACDQFTSDREYWKKVEETVGVDPSTSKITFAEVYLNDDDKGNRIQKINYLMKEYLKDGIVEEKFEGLVLVDRQTKMTPSRKGLVLALDLERYDYHKGSKTLIRATEGTVESRIPPRLAIRKEALMEIPHIMVLINDPNRSVIEPLFNEKLDRIYEFELMLNGGRVKGRKIDSEQLWEKIADSLEKLISSDGLLFAMGDGNHSLATAKTHWDLVKEGLSQEDVESHPARFALVELVNIYDDGLKFEPIHRVVFNLDSKKLLNHIEGDGEEIEVVLVDGKRKIKIKDMGSNILVGNLQILLDSYVLENPETVVDYIHGEESLNKVVQEEQGVGFLLPGMNKFDLFPTVEKDGSLPRKTFSMGEAEEKRYYLEAKMITS